MMKFALVIFAALVLAANASDITRTYVQGVDGNTLINDITPGFLTPEGLPVGPTSTTFRTLPFVPAVYRSFAPIAPIAPLPYYAPHFGRYVL